MGTITVDIRYLDGIAVEVTASGVTGHTVVVNDYVHNNPDLGVKAPTGATVSTTTDAHGRKTRKIQVPI